MDDKDKIRMTEMNDLYLKVDRIAGESKDANHLGWINISKKHVYSQIDKIKAQQRAISYLPLNYNPFYHFDRMTNLTQKKIKCE